MAATDITRQRLSFVLVGIVLIALGVLGRLFFLQVTSAEEYRIQAERQHAIALLSEPRRGDIFFEDKAGRRTPAASTRRVYALAGNPQEIKDPEAAALALERVISLDRQQFLARARDTATTYVVFKKDLDKDTAGRIAALQEPGIWLSEEEARSYPGGTLGSNTLGFVGFQGDERLGRYGVEQYYEDALKGVRGSVVAERSAYGAILSFGKKLLHPKQDGYDLILTIDPNIQSLAATTIAEAAEKWGARRAGVLVMDPKTGALLAMQAVPSFDPNEYNTVKNYELFLNPFVQSRFEVGSIFKPLTMAAGIDAHAITPETTYTDTGTVRVGNAVISNYDGKGRGLQNMAGILEQSLNTGTVFIMRQLGMDAFRHYVENFGLGDVTGTDLPNEIPGDLTNLVSGHEVEHATASFGQGIAVTPVSLAAALSAVANGGELMRPYVVKQIFDGDTLVREMKPDVRRRVIRKETSETVSRMLTDVVDKVLAGGTVRMPGYSIAAKTGTAQIPNKDVAGYSDEFLHTFFGYAPAFDPKFLILLYLERPQGVRYASETLSQPFRKITEFMISYYEIPPDRAPITREE